MKTTGSLRFSGAFEAKKTAPSSRPRMASFVLALLLGSLPGVAFGEEGGERPGDSTESAAYPKLYDNLTSRVYRVVLKAIPYTRERAFHGNYGGSGNAGGPPVDAMDDLFRRHDILYNHMRTLRLMVSADKALCLALRKVDGEALDEKGMEFRDRALGFFESPASRVFGKTPLCWIRRHESPDSPFRSEEVINSFMGVVPVASEPLETKPKAVKREKWRSAKGIHARILGRRAGR